MKTIVNVLAGIGLFVISLDILLVSIFETSSIWLFILGFFCFTLSILFANLLEYRNMFVNILLLILSGLIILAAIASSSFGVGEFVMLVWSIFNIILVIFNLKLKRPTFEEQEVPELDRFKNL